MALLLVLFTLFPGTRIANLPTGRMLDAGRWQLAVSHRFLSSADNEVLEDNILNFVHTASVRFSVQRAFGPRLAAGAGFYNAGNELAVDAAWAPWEHLTACVSLGTDVIDIAGSSTWLAVAPVIHHAPGERFHVVALPRVTASTDSLFLSVGLGAELALGRDLSLGFETEPVLVGDADKLAWNLALDKELGWHNFTLTVGNAWHQSVPGWFAGANRDVTRGLFRIGFNILRQL